MFVFFNSTIIVGFDYLSQTIQLLVHLQFLFYFPQLFDLLLLLYFYFDCSYK